MLDTERKPIFGDLLQEIDLYPDWDSLPTAVDQLPNRYSLIAVWQNGHWPCAHTLSLKSRLLGIPIITGAQIGLLAEKMREHKYLFFASQKNRHPGMAFILSNKYDLITRSQKMLRLIRKLPELRTLRAPVFIKGERGTEKKALAQMLHADDKKYFIDLQSNQEISKNLEAPKKTLFVDSLPALDFKQQWDLLNEINGNAEFRYIIAFSEQDTEKIKSGNLLIDFAPYLDSPQLVIPPLRERIEDIAPLAKHYLRKFCEELNKECTLSNRTLSAMENYDWSENRAEVKKIVLQMIVEGESAVLEPIDFYRQLPTHKPQSLESIRTEFEQQEKRMILSSLSENRYSVRKAARSLQVSHTTLHGKMTKYGLKQIRNPH